MNYYLILIRGKTKNSPIVNVLPPQRSGELAREDYAREIFNNTNPKFSKLMGKFDEENDILLALDFEGSDVPRVKSFDKQNLEEEESDDDELGRPQGGWSYDIVRPSCGHRSNGRHMYTGTSLYTVEGYTIGRCICGQERYINADGENYYRFRP